MYRLFSHCLFLISPCFGASERLCCVIMTCPEYLHLYSPPSLYRHLIKIMLIKDSLQQQIHFNDSFGNICCRCNAGSLY